MDHIKAITMYEAKEESYGGCLYSMKKYIDLLTSPFNHGARFRYIHEDKDGKHQLWIG